VQGVAQIAAGIREGRLSSVEAVGAALAAIDAWSLRDGAFLAVDPEGALAAAAAADARRASGDHPPLLGVPIAVKDLQETRGLVTTYGSVRFRDNVPADDCIAVARLRAAGAIVVGKTHTPVFGLLGETKSRLAPDARNPRDPRLTTGGSSGGSAAAVAAGVVPAATGTDSAGSITAPAAMCGVVGLKPTLGRIPTWPVPDDSMQFLTHGPLAASVEDAVLLVEAMAGHDPRDPVALRTPLPDLRAPLARAADPRALAGLRIAWSADLGHFAVDREVESLCRAATLGLAEGRGADVVEAAPVIDDPVAVYMPLLAADTRRAVLPQVDPDELYPETQAELAAWPPISAEEYVGARARMDRLRAALDDFFETVDVLVTPATPTPAFPLGEPPRSIGGREVEPGWTTFMPLSTPWNMGGQPTVSIPVGHVQDGRPVGLMVIAGRGREDLLVAAGASLALR
jgi:Asp-tRNA(Asn)/Glu-tRNA(Gln) amidotransferase A subunit family amidase